MGSSSRSLQLKLMNCKGLQAFNFFQKLSVYVLVSLHSDDHPTTNNNNKQQQQQQRTPTDTLGDANPEWNHEMRFDLDTTSTSEDDQDSDLFLHFDLRSELALFGDKSLGQVRILLKDLIHDNKEEESSTTSSSSSFNGVVRFVSYEVRTSDNKPNGVLTFSYKLLLINQHDDLVVCGGGGSATATPSVSGGCAAAAAFRIDGYPVVDHVNNDLLHQHPHYNSPDGDYNQDSSYFPPSSYVHSPSLPPRDDHNLQIPSPRSQEYSYYSTAAAAPRPIHYPYPFLEPYLAAPAGEGYFNYPRLDHAQFYYPPPPPPPPLVVFRPPGLPLLSPPPFAPPPSPPPPPPPPHHHHHHHGAQGAGYYPPSPWGRT